MKKIFFIIVSFCMLLMSNITIADQNNCVSLYQNSYVCGSLTGKTLEWDDANIYTCNISHLRFYTSHTWTCGGADDLCGVWGYINGNSLGNPLFYSGGATGSYLHWDNLNVNIVASSIIMEVYFEQTTSTCGTIKVNNAYPLTDIDCDGDHIAYIVSGNTTDGNLNTSAQYTVADLTYYFEYTNASGNASVSTTSATIVDNDANLTGYFFNGYDPASHFLLGINLSINSDMSDATNYAWGTTGISQYFNVTVSNLPEGVYYYQAYGQNVTTLSYINGSIKSFTMQINDTLNEEDRTCNSQPSDLYRTSGTGYYGYLEERENYYISGEIYGAEIFFYYDEDYYYFKSNSYVERDGPPLASDFSMRVNNNPVGTADSVYLVSGYYVMSWIFDDPVTLENERPLFTIFLPDGYSYHFAFGYSPYGVSGMHDSITWAYNDRFDGSHHWIEDDYALTLCYYIETNATVSPIPPIPPDDLYNWSQKFKSEYGVFCEAYMSWQQCYYKANDNYLELIYNLSDTYLTDTVDFYKAVIYNNNDVEVFSQPIFYNPNQTSGHMITNFKFSSAGTYYLLLWNTSDNGVNLNTVVDNGNYPIVVCTKTAGGGGGTEVLPIVLPPLSYILGLIVTMFCLFAPFILAKGLNIKGSIPPLLYAFSGGIGLVVSTLLQWFPWWVISFIVVVGIIVTIFMYLKEKQTSSGG